MTFEVLLAQAIAAWAHCTPRPANASRPAPNWLPQTEVVLAQVEAR